MSSIILCIEKNETAEQIHWHLNEPLVAPSVIFGPGDRELQLDDINL